MLESAGIALVSSRSVRLSWLVVLVILLAASPSSALLHIDFEQKFYVHPGYQTWDFCVVQHDGLYNIFYHAIPMDQPGPSNADHIYRATSTDLVHWSEPWIVLSVSDEPYETRAVWAPDVVWDEETGLWWMSYTGVDDINNQRLCMAWSRDLDTWFKTRMNPTMEPDHPLFYYWAEGGWGECRDPFLYSVDDTWHVLASAKAIGIEQGQGTLALATSTNMTHWTEPEIFFLNDGNEPTNTLESVQYHVHEDIHHLFFLEYSVQGIAHIAAVRPDGLTFENKAIIDLGIAPEVDSFDGGKTHVFSRIAPYWETGHEVLSYITRLDTLIYNEGTNHPSVIRRHPLDREFEVRHGNITLGNPCFGDNPARRGEEPANPVGYCYFGSLEYYQGPLSGRGDPGRDLGETAEGYIHSYPFVVTGNSISLHVGGTNNFEQDYVALVDAATDSILRRETGLDSETMTQRFWDVQELKGRECYIAIVDDDHLGHISVDEIVESHTLAVTSIEPTTPDLTLRDHGPSPNPFNPATNLRFELATPARCRARIHDLRGRLVWDSGPFQGREGLNSVTWNGQGTEGTRLAGGVYIYRIILGGQSAASGKLTLIP